MYDYFVIIYLGMCVFFFCCIERLEDGVLILYYYLEWDGLELIVIGIVKEVVYKFYELEVDVEVIKYKFKDCDYV